MEEAQPRGGPQRISQVLTGDALSAIEERPEPMLVPIARIRCRAPTVSSLASFWFRRVSPHGGTRSGRNENGAPEEAPVGSTTEGIDYWEMKLESVEDQLPPLNVHTRTQ